MDEWILKSLRKEVGLQEGDYVERNQESRELQVKSKD